MMYQVNKNVNWSFISLKNTRTKKLELHNTFIDIEGWKLAGIHLVVFKGHVVIVSGQKYDHDGNMTDTVDVLSCL